MNLADLAVTIHADGVDKTVADIKEVGGAITATASKVSSMSSAMTGLGVAAAITGAIATAFIAVGKTAIDAALPLDSYRRALAALSKDVGEYTTQVDRLTQIAKGPGLGLQEVFGGATQLQGAGISADTTARIIEQLGNAVAVVGRGKNEFKGVVDQMAKMAGLGKVTMEDLNQIAANAPTVRSAFQRALGTLDADKIAKMGLSMEEIFAKVGKELEKDARGAVSFRTEIENLADSFQIAMEPLGTSLLSVWSNQSQYAQTFFDDLQMINQELGIMIMRYAGLVTPMQSAFGSPMLAMINAVDSALMDTGVWISTLIENMGNLAYNVELAFVRIGKAALALVDPMMGKATDTGYKKPADYEENRRAVEVAKNTADAINRASMKIPRIGGGIGPPPPPDKDKDKDGKETKNHLKRIEANTRKTSDALTFARQIFGGRQLGQLGVTAAEMSQGGNRFKGTSVIPGSTMINRGLQQIINQSQRNYLSTPLARY
jgi:tape measure domain-containing protein